MSADIYVVGLGPGNPDDITLGTWKLLSGADMLVFRTMVHPTVKSLAEKCFAYESFDYMYDLAEDFNSLYTMMAERLLRMASDMGEGSILVYAVPGHTTMGEESVRILRELASRAGVKVIIKPGVSFFDAISVSCGIDPADGIRIVDGMELRGNGLSSGEGLLIVQIYSRMITSSVKLELMKVFPDDHRILSVRAAGTEEEDIRSIRLYELDRLDNIDHLTTIYVPPVVRSGKEIETGSFEGLLKVMEILRSEKGCPWDKEQTHETLKPYMIEEAYEAVEAIDERSWGKLCEELGDVLLQVVFHSRVGEEAGEFDIWDVIRGINEKMIRRHPHVFGDQKIDTAEGVLKNWERIKAEEKSEEGEARASSVLDNVPRELPALMRAYRIQSKAAKVGFDWEDVEGALHKVKEEMTEFLEELRAAKRERIIDELGDLLFAIVNVSRFLKIDPEEALRGTIDKFIKRFKHIEETAARRGRRMEDMTLEEMDMIWEEAKRG